MTLAFLHVLAFGIGNLGIMEIWISLLQSSLQIFFVLSLCHLWLGSLRPQVRLADEGIAYEVLARIFPDDPPQFQHITSSGHL